MLDLSWSNIAQSSLQTIVNGFVEQSGECRLESLDLSGTCASSEMIGKLAKSVRTLTSLNLTSCRSVDRGMKKALNTVDLNNFVNL